MQMEKSALNHKYNNELNKMRVAHQLKLYSMTDYLGNDSKKCRSNLEYK